MTTSNPTTTTEPPGEFRPLPRRGRVILAVLQVLLDHDGRPVHGYRIAQLAGTLSGSSHLALQRLVDHGWATARWEDLDPDQPGRRRRLYNLTPAGAEAAQSALDPANPVTVWR